MARVVRSGLALIALLSLGGCADSDDVASRGIDQDITVTHDSGAPTVRNLSLPDTSTWLFAPRR